MGIYQKNLRFLEANAKPLYEKVSKERPYVEVLINKTTDDLQVSVDGRTAYLQSRYSKQKEWEWTFWGVAEDTEVLILFGCAFFQNTPYIVNKFKKLKKIIFVEPTLQIFDCFLHQYSFLQIFKKIQGIQLVFVVNCSEEIASDDIIDAIKSVEKFSIVETVVYQGLFPEYCKKLNECLKIKLGMVGISMANMRLAQPEWIREIVLNFFVRALPVELLAPIIENRPVILVGAGPSLAKNMNLLKAASEKAVIIAVGKAVQILNLAGIRPHFNAGLDSLNCDYYDNLQYPDVPLLFANQFSHEILQRYTGPKFHFTLMYDRINTYLYRKGLNRTFNVASGTSIINSVHDLVSRLGCKSVIFIGQDMCFYDDKLYAEGDTSQSQEWKELLFETEDIFGDSVYTLHIYSSIKQCIEMIAGNYPTVEVINATEGGLGMDCAENCSLSACLYELPYLSDKIQTEIDDLLKKASGEMVSTADCLRKINFFAQVREVRTCAERILTKAEELGAIRYGREHRYMEKIKQIQRMEDRLATMPVYQEVLLPYVAITFDVIEQKNPFKYEQNINKKVSALIKQSVGKMVELRNCCTLLITTYESIQNEENK